MHSKNYQHQIEIQIRWSSAIAISKVLDISSNSKDIKKGLRHMQ